MAKNTVLLYTDWLEQLQELSMEERGIIMTAILHYQAELELPKMDKLLKLVFIPIRQSIDRDNAAYIVKCEKNRENANKRWNANASERMRSDAKNADNDNDNENDKDNDNDSGSGSENDNDKSGTPPTPPPLTDFLTDGDIGLIIYEWNNQKCTRNIQNITGTRLEKTKALASRDYGYFVNVIKSLDSQQYLLSQAQSGKKVDFDWFIDPENYQKVIEGKYAETYGGGGGHGYTRDW